MFHQHVGRSIRFNSATSQLCRVKQPKTPRVLALHPKNTSSPLVISMWEYPCPNLRHLAFKRSSYIFLVQVHQMFCCTKVHQLTHLSILSSLVKIGEAIKAHPFFWRLLHTALAQSPPGSRCHRIPGRQRPPVCQMDQRSWEKWRAKEKLAENLLVRLKDETCILWIYSL